MEQLKSKAIKSQKLLTAKVIELSPAKYQLALSNKETLNDLGFMFDDFGNNTVKLSSIPGIQFWLDQPSPLLDQLLERDI